MPRARPQGAHFARFNTQVGSYTRTLLPELTSVGANLRDLEYVCMRASRAFVAKQGAWSPPKNGKQNKQVPWSLSILNKSLQLPLCTPSMVKMGTLAAAQRDTRSSVDHALWLEAALSRAEASRMPDGGRGSPPRLAPRCRVRHV